MGGALTRLATGRPLTAGRRPFVLINMAMTADGKIATANRQVSSFGSRLDINHLYELRATADAVMCGAGTVASGDVTLGSGGTRFQRRRVQAGLAKDAIRIVVSGSGSLDASARIFEQRFSPVVILTTERAAAHQLQRLQAVADEIVVCGRRELDWPQALAHLRTRWCVRRLLCEGGGELNDSLFRSGLVDELHLTICPLIFGGRDAPTISGGDGCEHLSEAFSLKLVSRRRLGTELFCVFRRSRLRVKPR